MSEHDINELRRQHEAAQSRLQAARVAAREARERLIAAEVDKRSAELAAAGTPVGRSIVIVHRRYSAPSEPVLLSRVAPPAYGDTTSPDLIFTKIKKGGTPGRARARLYGAVERLELVRLIGEPAE